MPYLCNPQESLAGFQKLFLLRVPMNPLQCWKAKLQRALFSMFQYCKITVCYNWLHRHTLEEFPLHAINCSCLLTIQNLQDRMNFSWKMFLTLYVVFRRLSHSRRCSEGFGLDMIVEWRQIVQWLRGHNFVLWPPTNLKCGQTLSKTWKKLAFLDHLPTSSCPRSHWTTPSQLETKHRLSKN